MLIRELEEKDLPGVEAILDLYWTGYFRNHLSEKLRSVVDHTAETESQRFKFYVAEKDGEVVGVSAMRMLPEHMKQFATTSNPAEFYILAVKYKNQGVGSALRNKRVGEATKLGYTEAIFYSAESHKDSWTFHDKSEFKRIGEPVFINGEMGQIWRMELGGGM